MQPGYCADSRRACHARTVGGDPVSARGGAPAGFSPRWHARRRWSRSAQPFAAEPISPIGTRLLYTDEDVPLRRNAPRILPWVSWVGWAVAAGLTVMATDLYRDRDDLRSAVANQAHQMSAMSVDAQRGRALMSALTDQGAMRVTLSQTPAKAVPQGRASYLPEKGVSDLYRDQSGAGCSRSKPMSSGSSRPTAMIRSLREHSILTPGEMPASSCRRFRRASWQRRSA